PRALNDFPIKISFPQRPSLMRAGIVDRAEFAIDAEERHASPQQPDDFTLARRNIRCPGYFDPLLHMSARLTFLLWWGWFLGCPPGRLPAAPGKHGQEAGLEAGSGLLGTTPRRLHRSDSRGQALCFRIENCFVHGRETLLAACLLTFQY